MEIRFELVLYYKETILLLSMSTIIYYLLPRFLRNKNALINIKSGKIKEVRTYLNGKITVDHKGNVVQIL